MEKINPGKNLFSFITISFNNQLIIVVLLVIFATIFSKGIFLTPSNLTNVLIQISRVGILAVGQTLVILLAGIDLSVGSVVALSTVVLAHFSTNEYGVVLPIIITLLVGLLSGAVTGITVVKGKVPAFIATLAMMGIARGIAYVITRGQPIYGIPKEYDIFGRGNVWGIPTQIIIWFILVLLGIFILRRTKLGRFIYLLGGNEDCAFISGVKINKVKFFVYTFSGLCAAIAGIVLTSRLNMGAPFLAEVDNMKSIAAVVIGGTSLQGGKGSMTGTLIGTLILGIIYNLLNILNVNPYFQEAIIGIIVLLAVFMNTRKRKTV